MSFTIVRSRSIFPQLIDFFCLHHINETDFNILSTDSFSIFENANHFLPKSLSEAPK